MRDPGLQGASAGGRSRGSQLALLGLVLLVAACSEDTLVSDGDGLGQGGTNVTDSTLGAGETEEVALPCTATVEACDGTDNDCDGETDEQLCDDANPCTSDLCDAAALPAGCTHSASEGKCDDGAACTLDDKCGVNTNGIALCAGVTQTCDDMNPCTEDSCDQASGDCLVAPVAAGTGCDDGSACTIGETCAVGLCSGGSETDCNDQNPCTGDSCDQASGCEHTANTDLCNDNNPCTTGDVCIGGTCAAGSSLDCDDGKPCTVDACDNNSGKCSHTDSTGACTDGNPCTVGDSCAVAGKCKGDAKVCNDDNPCTNDFCNQDDGACVAQKKPDDTACDDGVACTLNDACNHDGLCVGDAKVCNDGNPCTTDSCDKNGGGCVTELSSGAVCDDGNACTLGDACVKGLCKAANLKACDDGNGCTDDACLAGACVFTANKGACSDGSACTQDDVCVDSACKPGANLACNDGNLCTGDVCDKVNGNCQHPPVTDGIACEDGIACTQGDNCKAGTCGAGPQLACDDGNPCTKDTCDPSKGKCAFALTDGAPCQDGNGCTDGDACKAGKCLSGKVTCQCQETADCAAQEDGNLCNGTLFCDKIGHTCKLDLKTVVTCDQSKDTLCVNWSCNVKKGVCEPKNGPDKVPCDADGSQCSSGDACLAGICKPGPAIACDDNNPCKDDFCEPKSGCAATPNLAACQDGNPCTYNDHCTKGACKSGVVQACEDGNACTFDNCDQKSGLCVATPIANASCTDENPCTVGDMCTNGKCKAGSTTSCDDGNPCTSDACDLGNGDCAFTPWTGGVTCDDGNACTTGDLCSASKCQPGSPTACSDGNVCTVDSCDKISGKCNFSAAQDSGCSDGNPCTVGDSCQNGACQSGGPKVCQDGLACVTNVCDAKTGQCVAKAGGLDCEDGNACSSGDLCKGGVCIPGKWLVCNDANACTNDACAPKTGKCVFNPNSFGCDDGNACTTGDQCKAGACTPKALKGCGDGNSCTTESCDPQSGCVYTGLSGMACSDGSVCTTGDTCANGGCVGQGITCNDGNPCTSNSCIPKTGCAYTPHSEGCNDGNACTLGDQCTSGKCLPGAPKTCDDGIVCTDDACLPGSGECGFQADNSNLCSDGNACVNGEVCADGKCLNGTSYINCDDKNACTADLCLPQDGCVYLANPAAPCDDGNACTLKDVCLGGKCVSGAPGLCDDNNVCTADVCDPGKGCVHTPTGEACNDDNACTGPDVCKGVNCAGGAKVGCDDGNPCTADGCDKKVGCTQVPVQGNAKCDDGNSCTTTDGCSEGKCIGFGGPTCSDGNPCTADTCTPTGGCVNKASDGVTCDDGNPCTIADACQAGVCKPSTQLSCDDGSPCTLDGCDAIKGCLHTSASTGKATKIAIPSNAKTTLSNGQPAVATWDQFAGWTHALNGAVWLWTSVDVQKPGEVEQATFTRVFEVPKGGETVVGELHIATDGSFVCTLNGILIGVEVDEANWADPISLPISGQLGAGSNSLTCIVTNPGKPGATAKQNPAGLYFLVDITVYEPGGALPCQDGNACTTADWCMGVQCQAGAIASCDDNNGCTSDFCNPKTGCGHTPNKAVACNDGNACTVADTCSGGICSGALPAGCDDFNPCTVEVCDAKLGCLHKPDDGKACDDGDKCTAKDACKGGKCSALSGAACDDGNPCTTDGCAALSGCFHNATSGTCDDGNPCTAGDLCSGSTCVGKAGAVCDDGESCTVDACDAKMGCSFTPVMAGSCEDGSPCTSQDVCKDGKCAAGNIKACSDSEPCTQDGCDNKTGLCTFTPVADGKGKCEDGNLCTIGDLCLKGTCSAGTPRDCSDGNACTADGCDPVTGDCFQLPLQNGTVCDDGDKCTTQDACLQAKCEGKKVAGCVP